MGILIPILILMAVLIFIMVHYVNATVAQYRLHVARENKNDAEASTKMIINAFLALVVLAVLIALVIGIRRMISLM